MDRGADVGPRREPVPHVLPARRRRVHIDQLPNYLPLLYILLVPLGLLSFHTASSIWAVANIFMALASCALLGRAVGLAGWPLAGLTGLVLVSEPFSVALGTAN